MTGSRLYVGNLNYKCTEQDLHSLFAVSGDGKQRAVKQVRLCTDRDTKRPRGFGFVELGSPAEAADAISALDGTEFGGRTIVVSLAREKR